MVNNVKNWIELLSLVVGLSGALFGILVWYKTSIEKSYAAESDFRYLKKNQEEILKCLQSHNKELDRRCDTIDRELLEMRNWIQNLAMLIRGNESSSGISRKD